MEPAMICQSCSMPLDQPGLRGTEKDQSYSNEYCIYCYQDGAFVNPTMSLEEMKALVKEKMEEMHLSDTIIQSTIEGMPYLKRWNTAMVGGNVSNV